MNEPVEDDEDDEDDTCTTCGGEGMIMLSEAGPGEWGEDCFCDVDRPIECPECKHKRGRLPRRAC